jgi:hypothetical protein
MCPVGCVHRAREVGLLTELRYHEKIMGYTWTSRQDMGLRYVDPVAAQAPSTGVAALDQYRNL